MIKRLDHIGLAVRNSEAAVSLYCDGLGLQVSSVEVVAEQGVRATFILVGETAIELLEPLGESGAVARFLEKRGEGIHHLCFEVDDLSLALRCMAEQGVELINDHPVRGAHGRLVSFVHPRSANGVLIELSQTKRGESNGL